MPTVLKGLLLSIAALTLFAGSVLAEPWELVWSDEFNDDGLPDKAKWNYEEGFIRNNEKQYYTRDRLENARVEHGMLVIEARKEHFTPKDHAPVEYTSASLTTKTLASWRYGRIEVRAKLPKGNGVWPAIWTLGTSFPKVAWPACGEIDIMELVGKEPNHIYGTLHYPLENGKDADDQGMLEADNPSDDFHSYAVEWDTNRVDFFFDGRKYHTAFIEKAGKGRDNPFHQPHYLILNFALGGEWGGPIDDAILPQQFLIDYVRVYQRKAP
jgi:beta-glucanase (GH16 family)